MLNLPQNLLCAPFRMAKSPPPPSLFPVIDDHSLNSNNEMIGQPLICERLGYITVEGPLTNCGIGGLDVDLMENVAVVYGKLCHAMATHPILDLQ